MATTKHEILVVVFKRYSLKYVGQFSNNDNVQKSKLTVIVQFLHDTNFERKQN